MNRKSIPGLACFLAFAAQADMPASVPFTPSWQARHHLQWLADSAGLPLPVSHWPLPAAAVEQALDKLVLPSHDGAGSITAARDFVLKELQAARSQGRMTLHLRTESEALNGYGENYTPGSSAQLLTSEGRRDVGDVSMAGRMGARVEASPNSLQTQFSGIGTEGRYQLRPDGSSAVVAWQGWNLQAFDRQNWWGPGWQSSLVNGHNNPAWLGLGVQRGGAAPSDSAWLSWMGPWNLEVFVAKAQDPWVVPNQPSGFLFSGMRLTMKPKPWLEVGLSRGLQTAGAGRPGGLANFAKAFLGRQVNHNPGDPPDSSGQIAGYDVRATCPAAWGSCAVYTQWMGEDAAGSAVPLPYKFMSLWGMEKTYNAGRYRVFVEWADSNAYSLPWDTKPSFPGFVNGVYSQGYTQGARWVGPAQGSGSRVLTLGWMDAEQQRQIKWHAGTVLTSMGAYSPTLNAPHGRMWGVSASQTMRWMGMTLTPELAYTHLADGQNQGANKRRNLRVGWMVAMPF
ncbi:MAG: capsule assembly Wzi family protein [Limnohabitans sp.]